MNEIEEKVKETMSLDNEIVNNKPLNSFVDLSEIIACRLCGESNVKLKYIFFKNNIELQDKIHVLHIETDFNDRIGNFLPKQICERCLDQIEAFYRFKMQCQYFHSQWTSQIYGGNDQMNENGLNESIAEDEQKSVVSVDEAFDGQSKNIEGETCSEQWEPVSQVQENDVIFGEIEWIDDNDDEVDIIEVRNVDSEKVGIIHDSVRVNEEKSNSNSSSINRMNRYGFSYKTTAFNYIRKTDSEFECKLCEAKFKWSHQCELHVRYHTKETPFLCAHCSKGFMAKHYLNSHVRDVHQSCEFICKTCGRQFTRKYLLTEHEMEHSGSPKIPCQQCNLKFYGTTKLTAHIRNYHSNRNCTCDICGKSFKTKVRLSEHRLRHSGKKNFVCNQCDKRFVTKRELTVHLKRENH